MSLSMAAILVQMELGEAATLRFHFEFFESFSERGNLCVLELQEERLSNWTVWVACLDTPLILPLLASS